jgi:hypothetical protein
VFTILAVKISALAAAMGTPMLADQQPAAAEHASAPVAIATHALIGDCSSFEHTFAFHDDSALAQVTAQSLDSVELADPAKAEREVFIPSPGTIALLGVGTLAMRRKRSA